MVGFMNFIAALGFVFGGLISFILSILSIIFSKISRQRLANLFNSIAVASFIIFVISTFILFDSIKFGIAFLFLLQLLLVAVSTRLTKSENSEGFFKRLLNLVQSSPLYYKLSGFALILLIIVIVIFNNLPHKETTKPAVTAATIENSTVASETIKDNMMVYSTEYDLTKDTFIIPGKTTAETKVNIIDSNNNESEIISDENGRFELNGTIPADSSVTYTFNDGSNLEKNMEVKTKTILSQEEEYSKKNKASANYKKPSQSSSSIEEQIETSESESTDSKIDSSPTVDTSESLDLFTRETSDNTDNIPEEYLSALEFAQSYSEMFLSKKEIYKQLTSDEVHGFSKQAVEYALDNIFADWSYNAYQTAKILKEEMSYSDEEIEQALQEDGFSFTREQTEFAMQMIKD